MVAIARALLNDNPLLLVDEPTKGLAPLLVTEVAAALERVAELTTVLLVEQNLAVVAARGAAGRRARQGPVVHAGPARRAARRPGAGALAPRRARGLRIEHLRAADHHRPRPRRDVLPRRIRALADLRADGRPQLRARGVHHRRRVRDVVDVDDRSTAARGRSCSLAAVFGLARRRGGRSADRARADPAALPPAHRAGARHRRARARARTRSSRRSGASTRGRFRCRAG